MKSPLMLALTLFALILAASAEPPAWAKGWVIASVVIPADGDLKDAYVDFQKPDGQPVTLTPGVQTKEGVSVASVVWEGTPVRAKVRLRQGGEVADLFADAALVAKSTVQKKAAGSVVIEGKFIEMPDAVALALKDPAGNPLFPPAARGNAAKGAAITAVSIFKAGEEAAILAALQKKKGADLLSAPRVTTRSGQRAVIEIIREMRYATAWKEDAEKKGAWLPTEFETRNVGVTLEAEPVLHPDGTIDLTLTPQVVAYLGTVDVETGKPVGPAGAQTGIEASRVAAIVPFPEAAGRKLRPVFSSRKTTTSVSVASGTTLVLAGLSETEATVPFTPKSPGRRLIVFITVRKLAAE